MNEITEAGAMERYGVEAENTPEGILRYLKCLKIVAAADGFSEAERKWLRREMRKMNLPEGMLREVDDFDAAGASLEEYLPPDSARHNRKAMLLYDAIKLSHSDGYSEAEQAATQRAAAHLGLPRAMLRALEHLVRLEHEVRELRHALMSE